MKKKTIAILVALMLFGGCGTQPSAAPVDPSTAADTPDMETIIQQSVDEAVQQKMKEYEEELQKKDQEIDQLKDQLEDLTGQSEVPLEKSSSVPAENISSEAPASSQSTAPASSSQTEIPPQPEPEPEPASPAQPVKQSTLNEGTVFEGYQVTVNDWTTPAVSSGGRDWPISTWYFWGPGETVLGSISGKALTAITEKYQVKAAVGGTEAPGGGGDWSVWFAEVFNEYRNLNDGGNTSSENHPREDPSENENPQQTGTLLEEDALEVIRLTNAEREKNGLPALEMDGDLMELAQIRAEEVSTKYSHERPDGSHVVQMGYGENVGAKASAEAQVTSWMGSDGHRTNILLERYTKIGVGCYQADNGKHYWVQIFSR